VLKVSDIKVWFRAFSGIVLVAIFSSVLGADESSPEGTLLTSIVAIVGDDVITDYELNTETASFRRQFEESGRPLPNSLDFERQVLERLITTRVLVRKADAIGVRVADDEIARVFKQFADREGVSITEYLEKVETDQRVSIEDLRRSIREEIKINKLRQRELDASIKVSPAEVDGYILAQSSRGDINDEYLVAHILVKIPEVKDDKLIKRARDRVEDAANRIDDGQDFRTVATEISEASDALEGGILGWRSGAALPDLFVQQLKDMRLGQRSDIFESSNGFHILFLYDKRGVNAKILVEETRVSHILLKIDPYVDEQMVANRAEEIRDRLVVGLEDFGVIAKNVSEDLSAANGGDLGWLVPGEVDPEFESVMSSLPVGGVSQVFRTMLGYHILKVVERRETDFSEERKRASAEQALKQRKLEIRFEEWVRELRDTTYIEVKI
jgi:peptidyl-prolyl cis-trans isomerase SurA